MKSLKLVLVATIAFVVKVSAQDTLFLNSGQIIEGKVVEVSSDLVKYKKPERVEGPSYVVNKSEISSIRYLDGTQDLFSKESSAPQTPSMTLVHVSGADDQYIPQSQSTDTRIFKGNGNYQAGQVLNAAVIIGAEVLAVTYLNKNTSGQYSNSTRQCRARPAARNNQSNVILPLVIGAVGILSHIK